MSDAAPAPANVGAPLANGAAPPFAPPARRFSLAGVGVALSDLATAEELLACFRRCQEMKLIMADRQAGGKSTSGRYKKHDSARKQFIETSIEPGLRLGKMPSAYDWHMVFNVAPQESLGRGNVTVVNAWADSIKPDPRSKSASATADLDEDTQTSILRWAHITSSHYTASGAEYGKRGAPPAFRFGTDFGEAKVKGMTIDEVVRKKLGWVINYVCTDSNYVWNFKAGAWQVDLYNELWRREERKEVIFYYHFDNRVEWQIELSRNAREQYKRFAIGTDDARAAAAAARVVQQQEEDDPSADADVEIDFEMNSVNAPTTKVFERIKSELASGKGKPYESWESMWVMPPDPTITQPFDASAWDVLPICFWSPRFWARIGVVGCPCARHGWRHSRFVRLRGWRRPRLAKGRDSDVALTSPDGICSECYREHNEIGERLERLRAMADDDDDERVKALKVLKDAATYRFSTYHPRVLKALGERYSFMAALFPFTLSHRAALTLDVTVDVVRAARTAQSASDLEAMFKELRCLRSARRRAAFMSLQRLSRALEQRKRQLAPPPSPIDVAQSELAKAKTVVARAKKQLEEAETAERAAQAVLNAELFKARADAASSTPAAVGGAVRPVRGEVVRPILGPVRPLPEWQHMTESLSIISDSHLNDVIIAFRDGTEASSMLFHEQHISRKGIASADHHGKRDSRNRDSAGGILFKWTYTEFNEIGCKVLSVRVDSTSYNDASLVAAYDNRTLADMIYHDGQCPTRCVCDNPFKDGSGIKANVFLGKGLPILKFEGRLALVVTKEQCDAACAELRHRAAAVAEAKSYDAPLLGLDTETVTYLPPHHGEGTSSSSAAIAQLIADEEFGVIFALHKWPHVYASFKELMEDERIQKIANNIAHDVRHLSSRFPGLTIKSHVELSTRVKQLHPVENYKLSTLVCSLLEKRIDKRIDHRFWEAPIYTPRQKSYAIVDALAHLLIAHKLLEVWFRAHRLTPRC